MKTSDLIELLKTEIARDERYYDFLCDNKDVFQDDNVKHFVSGELCAFKYVLFYLQINCHEN